MNPLIRRSRWRGLPLAAAMVSALAVSGPAGAPDPSSPQVPLQTGPVNAGTLSCTLVSTPEGPTQDVDAELSCQFDPLAGETGAGFRGTVKRFGADVDVTAKLVLIWTVLAPEVEVSPKALEGNYVGSLGGPAPGAMPPLAEGGPKLIGGKDNQIELVPLTPNEAVEATTPAVSVLQLQLDAMRA